MTQEIFFERMQLLEALSVILSLSFITVVKVPKDNGKRNIPIATNKKLMNILFIF